MINVLDNKDLDDLNNLAKNFNLTITNTDFSNGVNHYLGYISSNQMVAFLNYSIYYERAEVNYIFVLEEYRHQHIATKLLEYMLENLNNLENVTLEVRESNIPAIRLYEKFGFKECAIRKKYYGNENALLMIKKFGDENGR